MRPPGNSVARILKVCTPQNCDQMNQIIALVLSSVQELLDRIAADHSKHLIAKTSLGWRFVSSLESLEGQVGHFSMVQLRSQEKAFLAHELALSSLDKSGSGKGAGGSGGGGGGGGGGKGGYKNKNKNKKGAKGGGHFVRNCPKDLVPE
jgi:uncharacterized membrane protein YgcG